MSLARANSLQRQITTQTDTTRERRALLDALGEKDTGQSMPDLQQRVRGTRASLASPAWKQAFPDKAPEVQPPATDAGAQSAAPGTTPQIAARPATGGGVVTKQMQRQGVGVANPPPINNAVGGQAAGASIAPAAPVAKMRPVSAPLTGPGGNKASDAANLAQNKAMAAPGGMLTSTAAEPPAPFSFGRQELSKDSPQIQALLDANARSNPDQIVKQKAADAIAANAGKEGAGMTPYGPVAVVSKTTPDNDAEANRLLTKNAPAAGRSGSAPQLVAEDEEANRLLSKNAPAAGRGGSVTPPETSVFSWGDSNPYSGSSAVREVGNGIGNFLGKAATYAMYHQWPSDAPSSSSKPVVSTAPAGRPDGPQPVEPPPAPFKFGASAVDDEEKKKAKLAATY